jgi:hypothetical protein
MKQESMRQRQSWSLVECPHHGMVAHLHGECLMCQESRMKEKFSSLSIQEIPESWSAHAFQDLVILTHAPE